MYVRLKKDTKDVFEFVDFKNIQDCEWEIVKIKAVMQEWTKQVYLDNIAQVKKELEEWFPQKLIEWREKKIKMIEEYEKENPVLEEVKEPKEEIN